MKSYKTLTITIAILAFVYCVNAQVILNINSIQYNIYETLDEAFEALNNIDIEETQLQDNETTFTITLTEPLNIYNITKSYAFNGNLSTLILNSTMNMNTLNNNTISNANQITNNLPIFDLNNMGITFTNYQQIMIANLNIMNEGILGMMLTNIGTLILDTICIIDNNNQQNTLNNTNKAGNTNNIIFNLMNIQSVQFNNIFIQVLNDVLTNNTNNTNSSNSISSNLNQRLLQAGLISSESESESEIESEEEEEEEEEVEEEEGSIEYMIVCNNIYLLNITNFTLEYIQSINVNIIEYNSNNNPANIYMTNVNLNSTIITDISLLYFIGNLESFEIQALNITNNTLTGNLFTFNILNNDKLLPALTYLANYYMTDLYFINNTCISFSMIEFIYNNDSSQLNYVHAIEPFSFQFMNLLIESNNITVNISAPYDNNPPLLIDSTSLSLNLTNVSLLNNTFNSVSLIRLPLMLNSLYFRQGIINNNVFISTTLFYTLFNMVTFVYIDPNLYNTTSLSISPIYKFMLFYNNTVNNNTFNNGIIISMSSPYLFFINNNFSNSIYIQSSIANTGYFVPIPYSELYQYYNRSLIYENIIFKNDSLLSTIFYSAISFDTTQQDNVYFYRFSNNTFNNITNLLNQGSGNTLFNIDYGFNQSFISLDNNTFENIYIQGISGTVMEVSDAQNLFIQNNNINYLQGQGYFFRGSLQSIKIISIIQNALNNWISVSFLRCDLGQPNTINIDYNSFNNTQPNLAFIYIKVFNGTGNTSVSWNNATNNYIYMIYPTYHIINFLHLEYVTVVGNNSVVSMDSNFFYNNSMMKNTPFIRTVFDNSFMYLSIPDMPLTITNSIFSGSDIKYDSNFILVTSEKIYIENTTFSNIIVYDVGGALYAFTYNLTIVDVFFANNSGIQNVLGTKGGAIYLDYDLNYDGNIYLNIYNTTFYNNTSGKGGSIYSSQNNINIIIENTQFINDLGYYTSDININLAINSTSIFKNISIFFNDLSVSDQYTFLQLQNYSGNVNITNITFYLYSHANINNFYIIDSPFINIDIQTVVINMINYTAITYNGYDNTLPDNEDINSLITSNTDNTNTNNNNNSDNSSINSSVSQSNTSTDTKLFIAETMLSNITNNNLIGQNIATNRRILNNILTDNDTETALVLLQANGGIISITDLSLANLNNLNKSLISLDCDNDIELNLYNFSCVSSAFGATYNQLISVIEITSNPILNASSSSLVPISTLLTLNMINTSFVNVNFTGNGSVITDESMSQSIIYINNSLFNDLYSYSGPALSSFNITVMSEPKNITINNSIFENNIAGIGGSLYNIDANLTIQNTTFINNTASFVGGAIFNTLTYNDYKIQQQNQFINNTIMNTNNTNNISSFPSYLNLQLINFDPIQTGVNYQPTINGAIFTNVSSTFFTNLAMLFNIVDMSNQSVYDVYSEQSYINFYVTKISTTIPIFTVRNCTPTGCYISPPQPNLQLSNKFGLNLILLVQFDNINYEQYCTVNEFIINVTLRNCVPGEYDNPSQGICYYCAPGKYSLQTDIPCQNCPSSATCPGGNQLQPLQGYWRANNCTDYILKCLTQEFCAQDGESQCLTGYKGYMCLECDYENGYSRTSSGECGKCSAAWMSFIYIIGTFILTILYQMWFIDVTFASNYMYFQKDEENKLTIIELTSCNVYVRLLTSYSQFIAIIMSFHINFAELLGVAFAVGAPTSTVFSSFNCMILSFFDNPESYQNVKKAFYIKAMLVIASPLIYYLVMVLIYAIKWNFRFWKVRRTKLIVAAICLVLVQLPGMFKELSTYISCEPFQAEAFTSNSCNDNNNNNNNSTIIIDGSEDQESPYFNGNASYLTADPTFFCTDPDYTFYTTYFIYPCVILWGAILPIAFVLILYINRKHLYTVNDSHISLKLGSLYREYREGKYYWGTLLMIIKLMLLSLGSYLSSDNKTKAMIALLIIGFYLALFLRSLPYVYEYLNKAEALINLSYIVTLFFMIYLFNSSPLFGKFSMGIILLVNLVALYIILKPLVILNLEKIIIVIVKILHLLRMGSRRLALMMEKSRKMKEQLLNYQANLHFHHRDSSTSQISAKE